MRVLAFVVFALLALRVVPAAALEKTDLTITTAAGQNFHFEVEVARTPQEQEYGLMFRKEMPSDAGMIFPQDSDRSMSFWMKNTLIPLDIVFITSNGVISHIAPDAKPLSEDTIPSGGQIRAVLELNGGVAAKLGIHVGDHVTFPGLGATK